MLIKLAFLSFCSIIIARLRFNEATIDLDDTKNSLTDSKPSLGVASAEVAGTSAKRLPPDPPKSNSITEKIEKIKTNWQRNQDQLNSVAKESKELSAINVELRYYLQRLESQDEMDPLHYQELSQAINELCEINNKLAPFKQLKLMELGDFDLENYNSNLAATVFPKKGLEIKKKSKQIVSKVPKEILTIISKKTWKGLGNDIVNEVMLLVVDKGKFLDVSPPARSLQGIPLRWTKSAFKIIDFLLKNKFADPEAFRVFFKNPIVIRRVIAYVEIFFRHELEESILLQRTILTQHWYWPFFHECFQALGQKEKNMINAYVLLDFKKKILTEAAENVDDPKVSSISKRLFRFFDHERYLQEMTQLSEIEAAKTSAAGIFTQSLSKPINIREISRQDWVIRDITNLFKLIEEARNSFRDEPFRRGRKLVSAYLSDLTIFIDQHISPGIIETLRYNLSLLDSIPDKHARLGYYLANFHVLKVCKMFSNMFKKARRHHNYIKGKYPLDWSKSTLHKSFFDSYLFEINNVLHQFHYSNPRNRKDTGTSNQFAQSTLDVMAETIEDVVKNLKEIQSQFQVK